MIGEGLLRALEANLINALNNEDSAAKCWALWLWSSKVLTAVLGLMRLKLSVFPKRFDGSELESLSPCWEWISNKCCESIVFILRLRN